MWYLNYVIVGSLTPPETEAESSKTGIEFPQPLVVEVLVLATWVKLKWGALGSSNGEKSWKYLEQALETPL